MKKEIKKTQTNLKGRHNGQLALSSAISFLCCKPACEISTEMEIESKADATGMMGPIKPVL